MHIVVRLSDCVTVVTCPDTYALEHNNVEHDVLPQQVSNVNGQRVGPQESEHVIERNISESN